jgi:phospholipase C
MSAPDRSGALDHIVVVLFENRSLDNVLGHLYGPGDGKNFDGGAAAPACARWSALPSGFA